MTRFKDATVSFLDQNFSFYATSAVINHLTASSSSNHALLCDYILDGQTHILDKNTYNDVWASYGWLPISGHSFRIGGTTSLLVSGVDPTVVKKMSRWSSDAYFRYLRTVEDIFHVPASEVKFKNFNV